MDIPEAARSFADTVPAGSEGRDDPPSLDRRETAVSEHVVQFHETDGYLAGAVADFIGEALSAGDAAIIVATAAHHGPIEARMEAAGVDLAGSRADGRYVLLDAADLLSRLMVEGTPDQGRFMDIIGRLVARAARGGRQVRVFGEMVALLAIDGQHTAAIRLEQLWNALGERYRFSLMCAYPIDRLSGEAPGALIERICAEHSRVLPAESYAALPSPDEQSRAIAVLQQKARRLEAAVAERERAEERLREALEAERAAREAAETALRLRDEFLSVASHELRTPLTTLTGQAQLALRRLARDGYLDPERITQSLRMVTRQADRLTRLLDQLLDISRLSTGRLMIERQPLDLAVLVEQVVSVARTGSDRHTIDLSAPPSLEATVDPLRIEQVLTNLLDNAVKFSPEGGRIEVMLAPADPAAAELSVRDHGLGIPPEKRGRIFERFYQAHASGHRSGLGLGLYICRRIVEAHGGDIRAEFPADGGACFTVRLPLHAEEPVAPDTIADAGSAVACGRRPSGMSAWQAYRDRAIPT
jgi:signal transduction histidine kinase